MGHIVLIKHGSGWGMDEKRVRKIVKRCILKRKFDFKIELSLIFVGVKKARRLNVRFRKKDYIPQVLAFQNSKRADIDGLVRLGDIVICTKKLKRELDLKQNRSKNIYDILTDWIDHGLDNLLK